MLKSILPLLFLSLIITSCSDDETPTTNPGCNADDFTIYEGPRLSFTKVDGSDGTAVSDQDRITDNVWITRDNNGGQIFNINQESSDNKTSSPIDTEWAVGTTDNICNLSFAPFRSAVGNPRGIVGDDLVLHLITDDVYIDIKFTSWTQGNDSSAGGFSYERTTP